MAEAQKNFTGEVTFDDLAEVLVVRGGNPSRTRILQVMLGTSAMSDVNTS